MAAMGFPCVNRSLQLYSKSCEVTEPASGVASAHHEAKANCTGWSARGADATPLAVGLVLQFGENVGGQAGIADLFREFLDGGEAIVGNLLLGDAQGSGHVAVGPAFDKQQFQHFDAAEVAFFLPLPDHVT